MKTTRYEITVDGITFRFQAQGEYAKTLWYVNGNLQGTLAEGNKSEVWQATQKAIREAGL